MAPSRKTPRSHKTLFPLWLALPQRAGPAMRRCPGGSVGARMCRLRIYGLRIAVRSKLLLCTRYPRVTHCCTVPRSAGSAALFERDSRDCDAVLHPCASAPCGSVGDRIRSVRICWLQLARAAPAHTLRARHALPHRPAKQEALRRLNATAVRTRYLLLPCRPGAPPHLWLPPMALPALECAACGLQLAVRS